MVENSSANEQTADWAALIESGPTGLKINGKEVNELRPFLESLAQTHNLNWWELANVLLFFGVEQVSAADHMADDTEAVARYSLGMATLYRLHREALIDGSTELAKGINRTLN